MGARLEFGAERAAGLHQNGAIDFGSGKQRVEEAQQQILRAATLAVMRNQQRQRAVARRKTAHEAVQAGEGVHAGMMAGERILDRLQHASSMDLTGFQASPSAHSFQALMKTNRGDPAGRRDARSKASVSQYSSRCGEPPL